MFIHQFQEQYTVGLTQKNSPNFMAKRHQHSEGDTSDWSTHEEPCASSPWGNRGPALAVRPKHDRMEGHCKSHGHKGIGTGCPGNGAITIPEAFKKHADVALTGGLGSAGVTAGLGDLRRPFQPELFCDSKEN